MGLLPVVALAASRTPVPAVEVAPHPCQIEMVRGDALCATYPVWEDRERKGGRRIGLNIVILPALQTPKAPEPIFAFNGGPGGSATEMAAGLAGSSDWRAHHDIVLIDQRGTGRSNPLDCDLFGDPPDVQKLVKDAFPVEAVRACREKLEKVADLRMYTTAMGVDDINDVRQWLHYGKVNLWGASYGTVTAQVYLRRHPESVRSAVLLGVAPVDELLPLHHAWAGQRAVDRIFQKCQADPACHGAYPRLSEEFQSLFDKVRQGVEVEVRQPPDGHTVRVRPTVSGFAEGIRHALYSGDGGTLPSMIHRAAQGDLGPIMQMAVRGQVGVMTQLSMGTNLSVTCAEDVPFIDDNLLAKETAHTFLGDARVKEQRAACAVWVRGPVPRDVHELVRTDVPVLLLSGARDAVTPPEFAERAAKYMTNSLQVVFPESSHGNFGACGRGIQANFFERGSVKGLDVSCAAAQAPVKFVLQ